MKPVFQTNTGRGPKFNEECGNCLQAALASVLELPLDTVPHFVEQAHVLDPDSETKWAELMNAWLIREFGLCVVYVQYVDNDPRNNGWKPAGYHLLSGTSPRGSMHETVGYQGALIHDPHPAGGGVSGDLMVGLFVRVDPARNVRPALRQVQFIEAELREGSDGSWVTHHATGTLSVHTECGHVRQMRIDEFNASVWVHCPACHE